MTTDMEIQEPAHEDAANDRPDLRAEIERLTEFKSEKVRMDNQTPCPSCTTLVDINANQCPFCDSNIAANNALIRESLRRLDEIGAELDGRHTVEIGSRHIEEGSLSFWERLKRAFSKPETLATSSADESDSPEPRSLNNLREGDQLTVVLCADPWYKVKTRDAQTGWVYSTIEKNR